MKNIEKRKFTIIFASITLLIILICPIITIYRSNNPYIKYKNGYYLGRENNPYYELVGVINKHVESIEINENTEEITGSAFKGCTNLTSIEIPSSVTSIGYSAFSSCSSLTSIMLPFIPNGYLGYIFGASSSSYNSSYVPKSLKEVIILDGCTSIGIFAFNGCSSLTRIEIPTSITIPSSVTSIGDDAFYNCSSLTSITFEENSKLTSIGQGAFLGCSNLTSIEIPSSVTRIRDYAFYGCSSLTIYCEASSEPSGWSNDWNINNRPVVWDYKNNK